MAYYSMTESWLVHVQAVGGHRSRMGIPWEDQLAPGFAPNSGLAGSGGASLAYDAHGNTTILANQQLFYDVAARHTKTIVTDSVRLQSVCRF